MNNKNTYKFQTENPIKTIKDDKLNRETFISLLKTFILNYKEKDCLTIGLTGEWGSGKTSIINMITETDFNEEDYLIIKFNPWNFTNQNNLIYQFFNEINGHITEYESSKNIENKIKYEFIKYGNKIKENGELNLKFKIPENFEIGYNKYFSEKPLTQIKKEINEKLKNKSYKILMIIDDIDRLTDDEIQQIFILTRSLADFPNFIYLLAFDRTVVSNSLKEIHNDLNNDFLDKIIQVIIPIPKISHYKLIYILHENIHNLCQIEEIKIDKYFRKIMEYIDKFILNFRDIKRLMNLLNFYLPLIKNELNVADFIAITTIYLFENEIYNDIKNNKLLFTRTHYEDECPTEIEEDKKLFNKILEKNIYNRKKISRLLYIIFPNLYRLNGEESFSEIGEERKYRDLKICSKKLFNGSVH